MSRSQVNVGIAEVLASAKAVASAVGDQMSYAVVGGGGCLLLGGYRMTDDIDIVVPRGLIPTARQLPPRSQSTPERDTKYRGIDIEILSPPRMFRGTLDDSTRVVIVYGVRVLHPILLLNAKCGSLFERSSESRKMTDGADIAFLLTYCVRTGMNIKSSDVPNATLESVAYTVLRCWVADDVWTAAGYVEGSVFIYLSGRWKASS